MMSSKKGGIKATRYGSIHLAANCEDCDWSSGATERGAAEDDARSHARKTGHRAVVEGGWSVMFELRGKYE